MSNEIERLREERDGAIAAATAMQAEIERLTRERDELRRICIAAVNATEGACGDDVSTEFLAHLPHEVEAMKGHLVQEQRTRLQVMRERDEALALLTVVREAAAGLLDNDGGEGSSCYDAVEFVAARRRLRAALATTGPAALAEVRAGELERVAALADEYNSESPYVGQAAHMATLILRVAARIRAEAQG